MSTTKSTVLVTHHLNSLKLPTMSNECEKVASRAAVENLDHLAYLQRLCELELIKRERRAAERRLKTARFPTLFEKTPLLQALQAEIDASEQGTDRNQLELCDS